MKVIQSVEKINNFIALHKKSKRLIEEKRLEGSMIIIKLNVMYELALPLDLN
jgi:hypothetical protein